MNGERPSREQVDLFSEQAEVRQVARRNTYTGKTYNSLDHISQFFNERGKSVSSPGAGSNRPPYSGAPPSQVPRPPQAPPARPPQQQILQPRPPAGPPKPIQHGSPVAYAPKPPRRTGINPGAVVSHPKYGTGTILRKEGDGDEAKITVSFPGYGLKKLIAKYAGLKTEE